MQTRNRSTFTFSQVRNDQDLIEVTVKLIKYTCEQSLILLFLFLLVVQLHRMDICEINAMKKIDRLIYMSLEATSAIPRD